MFGRGACELGAGLRSSDNFDIVARRFPFGLRDAESQKVHRESVSLCDKGNPVCMVSCDGNGECMKCVNISRSRSSREAVNSGMRQARRTPHSSDRR